MPCAAGDGAHPEPPRRSVLADGSCAKQPSVGALFMDHGDPTVVVNYAQRRHFAVLIILLEESLGEIEAVAAGATNRDGLRRPAHDLPADFDHALAEAGSRIRAHVAHLSRLLDLKAETVSDARRVQAQLMANMVRIEDSTSAKILGYGEAHPSVSLIIDPLVLAIHAELRGLVIRLMPDAA